MAETHVPVTVGAISENVVVLQLADGQLLQWPPDRLPAGAEVGDRLLLQCVTELQSAAAPQAILNELLDDASATPSADSPAV
jgi:hypothetical protein